MVGRLLAGAGLAAGLLVISSIGSAASLELLRPGGPIELGKPLFAELVYRGDPRESREGFHLEDWRSQVHVQPGDVSVAEGERRLPLRLYPRRSGEYSLPALAHGGAVLKPVALSVIEPSRDGLQGGIRLQQAPASVRVGELFLVSVEVDRLHESNRFVAIEREWDDFVVFPLPQRDTIRDGQSRRILSWAVTAIRKGRLHFELPAIERRGHGRFRFHLPLMPIRVRPLPGYLPPGTPVGELMLHSELIREHDGPHWLIRASAQADLPHGLPELEAGLAALAPHMAVSRSRLRRIEETTTSRSTVIEYRIPVPQGNLLTGPELQQGVYLPDEGRWLTVRHALVPASNPAPWQWWSLFSLLAVLALTTRAWLARAGQRLKSMTVLMLLGSAGIRRTERGWRLYRRYLADGAPTPDWLRNAGRQMEKQRFGKPRNG